MAWTTGQRNATRSVARLVVGILVAALLSGCGSRSELFAPAPESESEPVSEPEPVPGTCEDLPDPPREEGCGPLCMGLHTAASCEIALTAMASVDAEGFVSVQECAESCGPSCEGVPLEDHRVFAMGRLGAGHVIGWCDVTNAAIMVDKFDALGYLGRTSSPRVASIGGYPCSPNEQSEIPGAVYLGARLPAELEDASALAADWDVLVACGMDADFGPAFTQTVLGFVRDHGRGLLALSDYVCPSESTPSTMVQMNGVVEQAGFTFEPAMLWYGSGRLEQACVVDYPR